MLVQKDKARTSAHWWGRSNIMYSNSSESSSINVYTVLWKYKLAQHRGRTRMSTISAVLRA
jgi:hypothetical protein